MIAIFLSVVKLFLIIFVGFVSARLGVLDRHTTKGLSSLLVKVTLPAMIFTSMQREFSNDLLQQAISITALSFGVYGLYFLIALFLGRIIKWDIKDRGVHQFAILFSNVGFMGFPVLASVFGDEAVFFAAMYNIPFHFFVFTLGVYLMLSGSGQSPRLNYKLMLSPGIIMTIAGFIFFALNIKLPSIIFDSMKFVGDITIPLSMITVGSMLTEVDRRDIFSGRDVYLTSFLRLIILPVIVYFFVKIFASSSMMIYVPVVIAAMPVAVNAPLIAAEYKGNALLASRLLFISTALSLLTLPLVLFFLRLVM